jgi:hypothetical protein
MSNVIYFNRRLNLEVKNLTGQVESDQFDFLKEIKSGWVNVYVIFFLILIDFNWIACYLISSRVRSSLSRVGYDQFDLKKKVRSVHIQIQTDKIKISDQIGF